MPYAFEHLVISWGFGKLIELKKKIKLDKWSWFFLLFGALFPDFDYLIDWAFGTHIHRSFSHSLLGLILGFIVCFIFINSINLKLRKKLNPILISGFFSLGILTHLLADMAFGWPGVAFFWPLTTRFWMFGYGAADYVTLHLSELSKERIVHLMKFALIDMAVGIIWIGYLFFKGKIKEF